MTDISKYKNVSLSKECYQNLDKIRKVITPYTVQSRSGTINILINKEIERLNGKARPKEK
jgi:metal-responsive CopG/Arc/MetJ family transcriptional regulator|tara:strand:+ start:317 stop:496 length:180 start_codon:yes stop_codon:yes gene_type:complete